MLALLRLILILFKIFALWRFVVSEYSFSQVLDEILILRISLRMSFVSSHRLLLGLEVSKMMAKLDVDGKGLT